MKKLPNFVLLAYLGTQTFTFDEMVLQYLEGIGAKESLGFGARLPGPEAGSDQQVTSVVVGNLLSAVCLRVIICKMG